MCRFSQSSLGSSALSTGLMMDLSTQRLRESTLGSDGVLLPAGSVVLDDGGMPLKPRKLDRSARLAPVLQITAVAGPPRDPATHGADSNRPMAVATIVYAQSDTDQQPAPEQLVLRPSVGGLTAQTTSAPKSDGRNSCSPAQHATTETAQQGRLWKPVPAPRIVAVLKALQVGPRHAQDMVSLCETILVLLRSQLRASACSSWPKRLHFIRASARQRRHVLWFLGRKPAGGHILPHCRLRQHQRMR